MRLNELISQWQILIYHLIIWKYEKKKKRNYVVFLRAIFLVIMKRTSVYFWIKLQPLILLTGVQKNLWVNCINLPCGFDKYNDIPIVSQIAV